MLIKNKFFLLFFLLIINLNLFGYNISKEDDLFLDKIEKQTFNYFLECTNPKNGLVIDRANNFQKSDFNYSPASIAGVGFGLSSLIIGVERGWIDKVKAEKITLTTLEFFLNKMENKNGFYYHFISMKTGKRVWNSEISSIDTALFLAGVLSAVEYYDNQNIRLTGKKLFDRTNWQWMMNNSDFLCMGWKPETGFLNNYWDTYSESMIMYLMAIGSPTFPISPNSWHKMKRPFGEYKNIEHIFFPSLFAHQFSHAWIDFRNKKDDYADYFYNSIQATLVNRQFCIDNVSSFKTFNENSWGLTACVGPSGYKAYGVPPGQPVTDGTVAPSAAASSIVFTPEESINAMKYYYENLKSKIWGLYGFSDSFNMDKDWYAIDSYAINQGAMLLMIENYRSNLIWKYFMKNKAINEGLKSAGFVEQTGFTFNKEKLTFISTKSFLSKERPEYSSTKVDDTFTIRNLDFDSPIWSEKNIKKLILDQKDLETGKNNQENYRTEILILDNTTYMFLNIRVYDQEIISENNFEEMYMDDDIEVFIDPEKNKFEWGSQEDYQIVLSPDNSLKNIRLNEYFHQGSLNNLFQVKYKLEQDGYRVILSIPKSELNIRNKEIGFSIAFHNIDKKIYSDCKLNWFFVMGTFPLGVVKLNSSID